MCAFRPSEKVYNLNSWEKKEKENGRRWERDDGKSIKALWHFSQIRLNDFCMKEFRSCWRGSYNNYNYAHPYQMILTNLRCGRGKKEINWGNPWGIFISVTLNCISRFFLEFIFNIYSPASALPAHTINCSIYNLFDIQFMIINAQLTFRAITRHLIKCVTKISN